MQEEKCVVHFPKTSKHIASIPETSVYEIPFMYERAKKAFRDWSKLKVEERLSYFTALKRVMLEELEELAEKISVDTGKVKTEALVADLMPTLDFLKHLENTATKTLGRQKVSTPLLFIGKKSYVEYMPRGTVLVISPWNYPFQLSMVPILSALIGGNTVIAKPSEVTPYVGVVMEELFKKAKFPEGVIQFAHGGKELGAALTEQKPDYIFFTGSVQTGKIIGQVAAKHLIPITLELGGKDPMIVLKDANLKRAAKAAVWGAFTNSGQVCMSVERLYVEKEVYEPLLSLLKEEVAKLKQGYDLNDDVGSMTFPTQKEIVRAHIEDALKQGAKLETGVPPHEWKEDSMFLPLMVLSGVTRDMRVIQEETFGPVLPIIPFNTVEEAIELANDSEYGLNASVWSSDLDKAYSIASQLVSGAVVINDVLISVANHHLPFGGTKQSGIGRYHGEQGLRMFCHEKAIVVDDGRKKTEIQWYPYKGKYRDFVALLKEYYSHKGVNWVKFLKHYRELIKKSNQES